MQPTLICRLPFPPLLCRPHPRPGRILYRLTAQALTARNSVPSLAMWICFRQQVVGYVQIRKDPPLRGEASVHVAVLFVTAVLSQFSWDFHHPGQEILLEGYYSNLHSALESISLTMGPFSGWALKPGRDSVYSEYNGAKQNRKEPHCFRLPMPSVALHIVVHPCVQLQFCFFCNNTLVISQCTCLPVEVHFMEV